jgi:uncharacterized protein with GYD domain
MLRPQGHLEHQFRLDINNAGDLPVDKYAVLFECDSLGSAHLLGSGSAGARSQAKAVKALGGKVISQYVLLGQFDALVIAEFPSAEAASAFAFTAAVAGQRAAVHQVLSPKEVDTARDLAETATRSMTGTSPLETAPNARKARS